MKATQRLTFRPSGAASAASRRGLLRSWSALSALALRRLPPLRAARPRCVAPPLAPLARTSAALAQTAGPARSQPPIWVRLPQSIRGAANCAACFAAGNIWTAF